MDSAEAVLDGARILLVDDTPANLDLLGALLEAEGAQIYMAPSGEAALRVAHEATPDLILLDVVMPEMNGFEVCRRLKESEKTRDLPVLFVTAMDVTEGIVTGFRVGGVDYITKPFRDEEVLARVRTHLQVSRLARDLAAKNRQLEEEIAQRKALKGQLSMLSEQEAQRWGLEGFVGRSPTLQRIFDEIRMVRETAATGVLITGENGTGKELVARAIHFGGARAAGPFVPVNCAATPGELAESLLFGHLRGSFTGAHADRVGYFEMAHEGTLFLDEIGDMPPGLQAKLLRVLEDGEVRRIGASEGRHVDVRVVAATNADLMERMREGTFRQDLYYRLARFAVHLPPLRERRDDVPLLAQHFLGMFAREMGREVPQLSPAVLETLRAYSFPGNVRELKNMVERALIASRGGPIGPHHLQFHGPVSVGGVETAASGGPGPMADDVPLNLREAELWLIKRAIARTEGNVSEAARLLGTNRSRVYRVLAAQDEVPHAEGQLSE